MISSIQSVYGTRGFTTAGSAKTRLNQSFEEVFSLKKNRNDSFSSTLSLSEQAWFEEIRSRYHFNNMSWKQGQSLVSELVGRGVVPNEFNELGNAVVILFPPDEVDENGVPKPVLTGDQWVELSFDAGYENTTDYIGTLKSGLASNWEKYNQMVSRYGELYEPTKSYLLDMEKLLGILEQMGSN